MRNKRKQTRVLSLKTATIKSETMELVILCAILNMSEAGACILVPDPAEIPETFDLVVDPTGSKFTCTVKWRSENRIGVSFQSSTSS